MAALWNAAGHYIFALWFLSSSSSSFFRRLMSAVAEWMSTILLLQGMELRNFRRGRHRYSAGRPSRWASAHILVFLFF